MSAQQGREVVIVEAVRTPIGRGHPEKGYYTDTHPNELLGTCFTEVIERAGIEPGLVEDVIGGCVQQYGEQMFNVGRNAWLQAGLPMETPATTVSCFWITALIGPLLRLRAAAPDASGRPPSGVEVASVRADGSDRQVHVNVRDSDDATVSPDGPADAAAQENPPEHPPVPANPRSHSLDRVAAADEPVEPEKPAEPSRSPAPSRHGRAMPR